MLRKKPVHTILKVLIRKQTEQIHSQGVQIYRPKMTD